MAAKSLISKMDTLLKQPVPVWTIEPKPAFCVKTRKLPVGSDGKVFINFCTCDELPAPRDISESELTTILESEDPGSFKIAFSIDDGHEEVDKSGESCTAYDVIINRTFYVEKIKSSELFQTYVIAVAVQAIFDKFKIELDNNWIVLKNRKHVGDIKTQQIRKTPKPMITEMNDDEAKVGTASSTDGSKKSTSTVDYKKPESSIDDKKFPTFTLMKDSATKPTKISGKFRLINVQKCSDICLDVGRDRILLKIADKNFLDICIPFDIRVENVLASYSSTEETLSVEFPLDSSNFSK